MGMAFRRACRFEVNKAVVPLRFAIPVQLRDTAPALNPSEGRRVTGLQPGADAPRVLIVDDDQLNRGWLKDMLILIGFTVREAENGREAVLAWEQWRPHAILMDVRMPVIDGLEVLLRQGALSFEQFTGLRAPVDAMRAAVRPG